MTRRFYAFIGAEALLSYQKVTWLENGTGGHQDLIIHRAYKGYQVTHLTSRWLS